MLKVTNVAFFSPVSEKETKKKKAVGKENDSGDDFTPVKPLRLKMAKRTKSKPKKYTQEGTTYYPSLLDDVMYIGCEHVERVVVVKLCTETFHDYHLHLYS